MAEPRFGNRGKPAENSAPRFGNRGRPAGQKPNYVIPKRVKVGPVELNLTDAPDAQRLATQGFAFGQSPRIMGAMGAVMGVPDAVRQGRLGPIADAYRQNRQAEIDAIDKARARTGIVGTGIEIAGGMVTGGTIAKAGGQALARVAPKAAPRVAAALAPRAGSVGGKVARFGGRTAVAAGGGAVAGGVYGSGEGRAAENALYGAAGGAAAEPLVRGGAAVYRGVRRLAGKGKVKPEVKAARKVVDKVRPDAQALIDEANRLGLDPLPLLDVMRNSGKRTVRAAAMVGDEPQDLALRYQAQTQASAPDRAFNVVRKMTGRSVDLGQLRQQAEQALQATDNLNYSALEPLRVQVDSPLLQDLGTNQATSGVRRSARISNTDRRFEDQSNLELMAEALKREQNYKALGTKVSLQALEDVYRVMRDRGIGMMAAEGPQAVQRREGYALSQEANRLGESLANRFPQIADARMASQQARQNIEAIDLGFNAPLPGRVASELAVEIGQLPARRNVLAGAQARLQEMAGQNPLNALNTLANTRNMADRINAMGGPADDITRGAQIELDRARNAAFISPNLGSKSTPLAQDLAENAPNVSLTPYGIATKLMDFAYRRINSFTESEMEALVRLGVEPADLAKLQALAARDPDKIPSVVKGLLGTAGGIGIGGQINASGTSRGYPQ